MITVQTNMGRWSGAEFEKHLLDWMQMHKLPFDDLYQAEGMQFVVLVDGDWKHDHIFLDLMLQNFFESLDLVGVVINRVPTAPSDDDCYRAKHIINIPASYIDCV